MQKLERGVRAMTGAALLIVALLSFSPGSTRADDQNPEAGLTRAQYGETTNIALPTVNGVTPAAPVTIHKPNDAEKAELDRMHAVRVVKGKNWREMTPEERGERIKNLRETMPGVSLMLTVPGGDLWAVPGGEEGVNFNDILEKNLIRFWRLDEIEALPATVGRTSGNNQRAGRRDEALARAPEPKQEE